MGTAQHKQKYTLRWRVVDFRKTECLPEYEAKIEYILDRSEGSYENMVFVINKKNRFVGQSHEA